MKIYINGDSHAAAAEAVNNHAFAEDDGDLFYLGRAPHPENARVSWGRKLCDVIKAACHLDAESASSNHRILRTTQQWIDNNQAWLRETLIIIQWSTWERQEWFHDGIYYQIGASGIDHVPPALQERYKDFVRTVDWAQCRSYWHDQIWQFHQELAQRGIDHVFFNGNNSFDEIPPDQRQDWGHSFIDPYDPIMTYEMWLKTNGFRTVSPDSWHFGADAHTAWSRFMLKYIVDHKLLR